jgi:tRNA (mo5U34)-methyltransferase
MASRHVRVGPLTFTLSADRIGIVAGISLRGVLWEKLARAMKGSGHGAGEGNKLEASPKERGEPYAGPYDDMFWYHTFDFGNGVRTKGQFDHNPILHKYNLPASFEGQRVLDVATYDGFWAFEFERRGAREVVALDLDRPIELDLPPGRLDRATDEERSYKFGRGFQIAYERFHSKVKRVTGSVYLLKPEWMGTFDVVHSGDLLLHLNSPVRALQAMASVCTGYALISDVYAPELDVHGTGQLMDYQGGHQDVVWWRMSFRALEAMIRDAGFRKVEVLSTFVYSRRDEQQRLHHVVFKATK